MSRSVQLSVAGHTLKVRTDADSAYLANLAEYVTNKVAEAQQTGRTASPRSMALLAAINIADELFRLREEQNRLKQQVAEKSQRILHYLDRAAE